MFCKSCGTQLAETVKYCTRCGTPVAVVEPTPVEKVAPMQETAQTAMQPVTPTPAPVAVPPVQQTTPPPTVNLKQPGEDKATLSMALGIASIITCGNIACILAIVFGIMAKKEGYQGKNANIGITCGAIGAGTIVLALIVYIVYIVYIALMVAVTTM